MFKSYIGIAFGILLVIVFVSNIVGYINTPFEYNRVYHIGISGVKWKYQSGSNFIIWNLILTLVVLLYILLNVLFLTKYRGSVRLKVALVCIEFAWFVWMAYSIYLKYLSGFDKVNPYK